MTAVVKDSRRRNGERQKKRNGKDIMHLKIKKGDKRFQGFCLYMNTKHWMTHVTIKSIFTAVTLLKGKCKVLHQ